MVQPTAVKSALISGMVRWTATSVTVAEAIPSVKTSTTVQVGA